MNKKNLFLWSLYDFANSLIYINFLLYFAQWLVIDGGFSDFWYNALFSITTILLLCSAPLLAAYTDRHGGRKLFLNFATVGTAFGYTLAAFAVYQGVEYVWLGALAFLVGQYFYQLSFVFYNAMLEEVADEAHRARASGIGQFSNFIGQVAGVAMTLPFADSRLIPLALGIGVFVVLAAPMMLFFKESREAGPLSIREFEAGTGEFVKKLRLFIYLSPAIPLLAAFFFFSDAIVTISNNFAIVIERVFGASDVMKSLLLVTILAASATGGIVSGWLGDKFGHLKTLRLVLLGWLVAIPVFALTPTFTTFFILGIPGGFLIGATYAVSRAYLSTLLSKGEMTYGFSLYTLAERFSTFAGPFTWGWILLFMGNGEVAYRVAVASMTIFILAGLYILYFFNRAPPLLSHNLRHF